MKILIAEDEKKLGRYMEKGLSQAGYNVVYTDSGSKALEFAASEDFDLMLLDLMMPGTNGFDVLKNLRSFGVDVPVIIISALSDTATVVKGLELGAVDYIKKPFEWEELLARIRITQRKGMQAASSVIKISELQIDLQTRKVFREEREIQLTAKEFNLLTYMARNTNRVVSKNMLLENVWNMDFDTGSNIVEVYMYQLRQKIDKGFELPMIETVIGSGYVLRGEKL